MLCKRSNDDVNVIQTDIDATNGIIHSIDQVLVPSSVDDSSLLPSNQNTTVRTGGEISSPVILAITLVSIAFLVFGIKLSLTKPELN